MDPVVRSWLVRWLAKRPNDGLFRQLGTSSESISSLGWQLQGRSSLKSPLTAGAAVAAAASSASASSNRGFCSSTEEAPVLDRVPCMWGPWKQMQQHGQQTKAPSQCVPTSQERRHGCTNGDLELMKAALPYFKGAQAAPPCPPRGSLPNRGTPDARQKCGDHGCSASTVRINRVPDRNITHDHRTSFASATVSQDPLHAGLHPGGGKLYQGVLSKGTPARAPNPAGSGRVPAIVQMFDTSAQDMLIRGHAHARVTSCGHADAHTHASSQGPADVYLLSSHHVQGSTACSPSSPRTFGTRTWDVVPENFLVQDVPPAQEADRTQPQASHTARSFRNKSKELAQDRAAQYKYMLSQGHSLNPCNSKLHPAVLEAGIMPDKESEMSVQEAYTPNSHCFGCGPSAPEGLHLSSHRVVNGLQGVVRIPSKFCAFPGIINGGIVSTLIDCHGNWTAAIALMDRSCLPKPPLTMTSNVTVSYKQPAPPDQDLLVRSQVVNIRENTHTGMGKASVEVDVFIYLLNEGQEDALDTLLAQGTVICKRLGALRAF